MDTPHPELMEFYETDSYFLEKSGALSPNMLTSLQVAAPLASLGLMSSDKARREKILLEAEAMNQAFRWVEKQRMAAMSAGFGGNQQQGFGKFGSAELSPELTKVAEGIGRRLAHEANMAELMEKAASGAELTEMEKAALIGKLLGGIGKALGGAGKAIGGTAGLKVGRGGLAQKAGDFLRKKGIGAQTAGLRRQGIKAALPGAAKKSGGKMFGLGSKAKLLGAGALALGGYGAFKGVQAGRDYMMKPTSQERMGRYGVAPRHNVGPMGYNIPQF